MSTPTQPAAPDADEPTAIVADDKASELAALAWSDDDDDDDQTVLYDDVEPFDDADRTTFWLRVYAGIIAAVVVLLAVVLWYVLSQRTEPEPTAAPAIPTSSAVAAPVPSGPDDKIVPSTTEPVPTPPPVIAEPPPVTTEAPSPTTVYVPTPAPAPVTPHRSGADAAFLDALREDGIIVTNPAEAIAGGRQACELIGAGHTAHDIMRRAIAENPTLTPENASILIGAAIGAYCPQYTGR
jgi:serine/threonine protein kinase, bacterial